LIEGRWRSISSGADYSATYRTYGSYAVGISVANEHPIAGVGIGSMDLAKDTILRVQSQFRVPVAALIKEWRMSLNNAFAFTLVNFGYIGGVVIWALMFRLIRSLSGRLNLAFFGCLIVLSLTWGPIYAPKFFVFLMLFVAINHVCTRDKV
jgi:hypothetical protein